MFERKWKGQSLKMYISRIQLRDSLMAALWLKSCTEKSLQDKTSCTIQKSSHLRESAHSNHTLSTIYGKDLHVVYLRGEMSHAVPGRFFGRMRGSQTSALWDFSRICSARTWDAVPAPAASNPCPILPSGNRETGDHERVQSSLQPPAHAPR